MHGERLDNRLLQRLAEAEAGGKKERKDSGSDLEVHFSILMKTTHQGSKRNRNRRFPLQNLLPTPQSARKGRKPSLAYRIAGLETSFRMPSPNQPLMAQSAIQPCGHLPLPSREPREAVPAPGPVLAAGNANNIALHANFLKRGLKIGRLGKRNVLVLVAENLQKGRASLETYVIGEASLRAAFLALSRNQRIEQLMDVAGQGEQIQSCSAHRD